MSLESVKSSWKTTHKYSVVRGSVVGEFDTVTELLREVYASGIRWAMNRIKEGRSVAEVLSLIESDSHAANVMQVRRIPFVEETVTTIRPLPSEMV